MRQGRRRVEIFQSLIPPPKFCYKRKSTRAHSSRNFLQQWTDECLQIALLKEYLVMLWQRCIKRTGVEGDPVTYFKIDLITRQVNDRGDLQTDCLTDNWLERRGKSSANIRRDSADSSAVSTPRSAAKIQGALQVWVGGGIDAEGVVHEFKEINDRQCACVRRHSRTIISRSMHDNK